VKGLHQLNKFERVSGSNKTRVTIQLSLDTLDTTSTGYQAPLPTDQVEEKSLEELKTPPVVTRPERVRTRPDEPARKEQAESSGQRGGFRGRASRGRGARGGRGGRLPRTQRNSRPSNSEYRSGETQGKAHEGYSKPITANATPKEKNEVRISSRVPARAYFRETVLLFKEFGNDTVVLKASGTALPNAVRVVEDVKRRIGGLHQVNHFDRKKVEEVWKSKTEGREDITEERFVPSLEITLSLKPLSASEPGYQAPLPTSEVKEISLEEANSL
jgi:DNA-binding protein